MNKCYHCGKSIIFGRRHTHHRGVAGGRWKKRAPKTSRIFKPNLQHVDIIEDGEVKRVRLCTKCLKRIKKDLREGKRPFLLLKTGENRTLKIDKVEERSNTEMIQSPTA
ncbi:hypothetical protein A3I50_05175 [Candidatus Roizmanbacteria bacterium RIFCSPLOWO2_02_FULL_37_9]|uniref:Large ribosomal subunit protein bL28 n=1 Tax=Candidatus Roizmanbacteria bacterium RIFCSPLOWO2_01_FULL_37_16 TaxID=1802058 RepID=A0A1F7IJB5_9BACT|nr:MAG: hypothetical protein A2859_05450 [Candidatus Roizmanbacteria bacterium RIFCSPHIGHO2_01_FULL_37_16b]OGK43451.1 MAG: hypothetical protein A3B40_01870 [Candidatus Roizmanbacteria bacterium RIFCSPLOWO2_01_FULL_37_16]OGK56233.1 MAG: hypothetical protein A3I50_05175 [Candidatus Roizmanbacteria bacterium RIFCSPLOWO2_02_FULL_37_9]